MLVAVSRDTDELKQRGGVACVRMTGEHGVYLGLGDPVILELRGVGDPWRLITEHRGDDHPLELVDAGRSEHFWLEATHDAATAQEGHSVTIVIASRSL